MDVLDGGERHGLFRFISEAIEIYCEQLREKAIRNVLGMDLSIIFVVNDTP